jgi:P-type Cu2+ transporter
LPADKIARLEELKAAGRRVLMIGDGLNDAPALAAGHASLSPSTATDIAQTAADAILQGERLTPVLEVLVVARASRRMALQNFAIALGYNCMFVPLAVIGLVTPLLAAIAMSLSSIAVTANAVRLTSMSLRAAP